MPRSGAVVSQLVMRATILHRPDRKSQVATPGAGRDKAVACQVRAAHMMMATPIRQMAAAGAPQAIVAFRKVLWSTLELIVRAMVSTGRRWVGRGGVVVRSWLVGRWRRRGGRL
jgi:hypothetical protein